MNVTPQAQSDIARAIQWLDYLTQNGATPSEIAAARGAVEAAMSNAGLSSATANGQNAGIAAASQGMVNGVAPSAANAFAAPSPSVEIAPSTTLGLVAPSVEFAPNESKASPLSPSPAPSPAPGFTGNSSTLSNGMTVNGVNTTTAPGISLGNPGSKDQSQGRVDAFASPGIAGALSSKDQAAIDAMGRQGINQDQSLSAVDPFAPDHTLEPDPNGGWTTPGVLSPGDLVNPGEVQGEAPSPSLNSGRATLDAFEAGSTAAGVLSRGITGYGLDESAAEGKIAQGIATGNQGLIDQGNKELGEIAKGAYGSSMSPGNISTGSVVGAIDALSGQNAPSGRSNLGMNADVEPGDVSGRDGRDQSSGRGGYAPGMSNGQVLGFGDALGLEPGSLGNGRISNGVASSPAPGSAFPSLSEIEQDGVAFSAAPTGDALDEDGVSVSKSSPAAVANPLSGIGFTTGVNNKELNQSTLDVLGIDLDASGPSTANGKGNAFGSPAPGGKSNLGMTADSIDQSTGIAPQAENTSVDAFGNSKGSTAELDNATGVSGALGTAASANNSTADAFGNSKGNGELDNGTSPGSVAEPGGIDAFGPGGMDLDGGAMGYGGAISGLDAFGNGMDLAGMGFAGGIDAFGGADAFGGSEGSGWG